jgi:hypothetical protein
MKTARMLRVLALAAAASSLGPLAMAQNLANATVTTSVNLTSVCRWLASTTPSPTVDFGTYTAFGGAKSATATTVSYECTRGFGANTPTIVWDAVASISDATGNGQVGGLSYTLSATTAKTAGAAPTLTVPGGSADTYVITLGGSMPGGQAGTNAAGPQTATRTLYVTY